MAKKKKAKSKPGEPTQKYVDIAEIRDDMVIMKDGTVRAVLLVSSINFALKSADEQEAIVQSYMSMLNSLDYPIQVVVQSRKMNIDHYLERLIEQQRKTDNDLLRAQIADYRNFIGELVELGEIMRKQFYITIPYNPLRDKRKNFFKRMLELLTPGGSARLSKKALKDRIEQLSRRVNALNGHLGSMGLKTVRLDTQGLIELFYKVYNPDIFSEEPLSDIGEVRHEPMPGVVKEES